MSYKNKRISTSNDSNVRVYRVGGILMKYPFFISKKSQDSGIYSIQKLLQYYHIEEEAKNIKLACNAYQEALQTKNIISCLHQYNIEAKEVTVALKHIKTPCILYCYHDPNYLFIYKRNKKYYMIDSFDKGKCKMTASQLAISYTDRYLEIQHVGRVKKTTSHTSFWKFLSITMIKHKSYVLGLMLFSILYTSVLTGASQVLRLNQLYRPQLLIVIFVLVANILLAIQYVLKNILLLFSQMLVKNYVHQEIINITVNDTCDLQSKQAMTFMEYLIQWISICSIDVIIWFGILGIMILRYQEIGVLVNIGVLWWCLLYHYYCQMWSENKSIDNTFFSKWDMYIKNQHYLNQFQYQKSYTKELDKQFMIQQKEYLHSTIRKNRIIWLLGVVSIVFIVGIYWLWEWMLKSEILSFWHSISIILLFIVQIKTVANIYRVIQTTKDTKQTFESYKELQIQPILQAPRLRSINSIYLHQICSRSLKYFDLQINHSMFIQGKQEEIDTIFNSIIGKLTYRGSVYINKQIMTGELIPRIQEKVIVLENQPVFLEESVSYHLLGNRIAKKRALFLLNTFRMENIAANLDVLLDTQGNPLNLEQKQMVMLIRAILLKPDVILINNGLSSIDMFRYERILIYLQTCLPKTIVVLFDCLTRKVPTQYQNIVIKEGRVIKKG